MYYNSILIAIVYQNKKKLLKIRVIRGGRNVNEKHYIISM